MATLTDRLDALLGTKAATSLEDVFDICTVGDLLRHCRERPGHDPDLVGEIEGRGALDQPRNASTSC